MSGPAAWPMLLALSMAAAQLQVTTGRTALSIGAAVVALAAWASRRRWRFGSAGEVLALLALGVLGLVIHGLEPGAVGQASAPLRSSVFVFAFTGLGVAVLRLHLDRPEGGAPATLAAAGVVFLACGTVRTGSWLPWLLGLFLLFALAALAVDAWQRGHAPAPWRLAGRHAAVALVLAGAVPATMLVWAGAGPKLIRSGTSYLLDRIGSARGTGFHDGPITLHALDGLLDSDEVVLRIDGSAPRHLRGNVYVHYARGRWQPPAAESRDDGVPLALAAAPPDEASVTRIEYAGGDSDRFFLPLGARPHALEPETASVDAWRIVRASDGVPASAELLWPPPRASAMAPPSAGDLEVPDELREALIDAAHDLAPERAAGPAEAVDRLASGLATRLAYSLDFRDAFARAQRARPQADPVVLFLEDVREGHCEYFASALALMLRARGVPARFVTGYRVLERNPIGDYAVVRERHAHAWVEAYLPGEGWVTVDGTPMAGAMQAGRAETPPVAALFDWLARTLRRHGQRLLLVVLVVGLAAAQIVRLWRGRRAGPVRGASGPRNMARALERLLHRLARSGFERAPAESLESLARRLRGACHEGARAAVEAPALRAAGADPAYLEAADLLDRYAAHRYGDQGDWRGLERELASWPASPRE